MLATLGHPPGDDGWAFEQKWDGQRAIADTRGSPPVLWSRNGNDVSVSFPEIVDALASAADGRDLVLDGEIVALDTAGIPSFSLLQRRMHVQRPSVQLRTAVPVTYYLFDVLDVAGTSTMALPYLARRETLSALNLTCKSIAVPPHWVDVDGALMLDIACKHRLEGIVAKKITSTYQPGKRSPAWVKTPLRARSEAIVCGYIPGVGSAAGGVGSLLLGAHDDTGALIHIGHVGTGFSDRMRHELRDRLREIERPTSPFVIAPPRTTTKDVRWVEPMLVCDVEYREFVGGALRHPAYKGLRADKSIDEVDLPGRH